MYLTKLLVKITNPSLVNYKCLTNHIGLKNNQSIGLAICLTNVIG